MNKLVSTKNIDHESWLRYRKQGIGGSDAGAICGLNPFASPMTVFVDKTMDAVEEKDSEAMRQGRDLEEYVARRFMEETGKQVRRSNYMYSNERFPFMIANGDRMVVGENAGLECKTASAYSTDQWKDGNVPPHYFIQCCHYMAVTGADAWYLAVVILGRAFQYIKIDRDERVIDDLISVEKEFWEEHVMKRIPPTPDGSPATEKMLKEFYPAASEGKTIVLEGYDGQLQRYSEINPLIDKLEKEKAQIEQEIKAQMQDAEIAQAGQYLIKWTQADQTRLDSKRLKEEEPAIYTAYSKTVPQRRFSIRAA